MEGTVVLLVQVDAAGHPVSVDVQTSSGHIELDEAAQRQVREWLFAPAVENGIPHAALARVPVTFRLNP
jgi:protein TonB